MDNGSFRQREAASQELAAMGAIIEPELHQQLKRDPSQEKRNRLRQLMDGIESENVRRARAITALQWANTPESRQLLTDLAGGDPASPLTKQAKAALQHLPDHNVR